jgi:4-amino-4-deoxy-L-arabinose transferase-like glycosyltransferase
MNQTPEELVPVNERFQFLNWCRTGRGATSLLLVLVTGFLLGYYGWLSLAAPPLPTYRLNFGNAKWIRAVSDGPNGYFRKKFFLNGEVEQAWIQVAATDAIRLSINGSIVSGVSAARSWTASVTSADPTVLCDITKLLKSGTNAVAVQVLRSTYPGVPELLLQMHIRQKDSQQEIISDGSWRADNAPGIVPSLVPWQSPECDDEQWPKALELPGQPTKDPLMQAQNLPPAILKTPFAGKWIGDPQSAADQATFRRRFDVPPDSNQSWLEVSAAGDYTVTLNGHWLGDLQRASALEWIYLQPFIKPRGNELAIRVRAYNKQAFLVAQIASLGQNNELLSPPIGSDDAWEMWTEGGSKNGGESRKAQAIGRFNYTGNYWGVPPASGTIAQLSYTEASAQVARGWLTLGLTMLGVYLLWRTSAALLARLKKYSPQDSLGFDALLHFPVALIAGILLLLRYEIRLRWEWALRPEFFFLLLALLVGLRLLVWLFPGPKRSTNAVPIREPRAGRSRSFSQKWGFAISLGVIVVCAFVLRVWSINTFPLDQDDIFMRNCAHGIFVRGYPSLDYGGIPRRLTTYELIPWPIALSALVFGWTDWSVRIPALVFGTLSTLLIGRAGKMFFKRGVGLFAAAVYAFLPWNCFWSLHCFHPSQTQFFSLLCIPAFYAAIRRPDRINQKHWTRACIFFCCSFLSWEGSGFLLPAFAAAIVLMHPGRWGWLRQRHLWLGLFCVGALVMLQWASRTMAIPPYLQLGYGLAELSTPVLFFLDPECQPFYYVQAILLVNPYLLLTILFCGALLMVGKSAPFRFCVVVYAGLLLSYSVLLNAYSQRYGYFYQWILIVGASAMAFEVVRRVQLLSFGWKWFWGRWVTGTTAIAGLLLLFISTTNVGLMFYRLSSNRKDQVGMRYWLRWQDPKSSAVYVWANWQPGDIVVAGLTQAFELYGGKLPDYGLDTLLSSKVVYDNKRAIPRYEHRLTSIPIVLSVPMTWQLMQSGRRIWFATGFEPNTIPPAEVAPASHDVVIQLLTRNSRIVYTSYSSNVFLYEGYPSVPTRRAPDLADPPHPASTLESGTKINLALTPVDPPFAQLPFKQPLRPNVTFDQPSDGLVEPLNTPSPDQHLIPGPGSLEPAPQPQSTPLVSTVGD